MAWRCRSRPRPRKTASETKVLLDLRTALDNFCPIETPAEVKAALESLTGASRLDADYVKSGAINKFITYNGTKIFVAAHTATSGEASANQSDIDTGFAAAPDVFLVQILRAGVDVKSDAIVTALTAGDAGKVRIADGGATYVLTAGDVIHLLALKL